MRQLDLLAFVELMEQIRDLCYKNSVAKGFWDEGTKVKVNDMGNEIVEKPWNFGEKIALIHSELSEMFEAWRKNKTECDKDIEIVVFNRDGSDGSRRITAIEEEMADTFIRLLDLCGKLDVDVGRVILAKMEYNKGRPYMHGGRKC